MAARRTLTFSPLPGSHLRPLPQCREISRRRAGWYRRPMILQTALWSLPRTVQGKTTPPSLLRALWLGKDAMPLSQSGSAPSERRVDRFIARSTKELLPMRRSASFPPLALLGATFRQTRGQTGALPSLATPLPRAPFRSTRKHVFSSKETTRSNSSTATLMAPMKVFAAALSMPCCGRDASASSRSLPWTHATAPRALCRFSHRSSSLGSTPCWFPSCCIAHLATR